MRNGLRLDLWARTKQRRSISAQRHKTNMPERNDPRVADVGLQPKYQHEINEECCRDADVGCRSNRRHECDYDSNEQGE